MMSYMDAADVVVSMGGYNTICEILTLRKRAVVVPRTRPVQEQLIRAERMARLGLMRVIHPAKLGARQLMSVVREEMHRENVRSEPHVSGRSRRAAAHTRDARRAPRTRRACRRGAALRCRRPRRERATPARERPVAILAKTWPKLSETFVLGEILGLERRGYALRVYALAAPQDEESRRAARGVRAPVALSAVARPAESAAAARARRLRCSPRRCATSAALVRAARRSEAGRVHDFLRAGWLASETAPRAASSHLHAHFASEPAGVAELASRMTGHSLQHLRAREGHLARRTRRACSASSRPRPSRSRARSTTARTSQRSRRGRASCACITASTRSACGPQRAPLGAGRCAADPERRTAAREEGPAHADRRLRAPARGGHRLPRADRRLRARARGARGRDRALPARRARRADGQARSRRRRPPLCRCRSLRPPLHDRRGRRPRRDPERAARGDGDGPARRIDRRLRHSRARDDGRNGLLVAPEDATALADAMRRLLDDDALRARLGAAARATVTAHFTDRNLDTLCRLLPRPACAELLNDAETMHACPG